MPMNMVGKVVKYGVSVQSRAMLSCGVAAFGLALSSMASARTDAAEGADQGNEIVVTATKREQTLQDVPVAVTVTTAETLERAQIRDIRDLSSVVPSLRVNQLQSSANTNFYIRGFGNGANNAGIEPSVGLFIDGVYRSRSASMIADFPDVERIEVLRGPQSTLFGKNASAGVISITTQKPKFSFGGNVEAIYGNFDALVLKGMVTGPVSDTVAASLAGGYNTRDGYIRDLGTGSRTNDRDRWFLRGQLLFEPGSRLSVRLTGDYGKIDENCCAAVNLQPSGATAAITGPVPYGLGEQVNSASDPFGDTAYNNFNSTNAIENWGFSGQVDYDMGDAKLTSITAYRRTDAVTNQDSDFTSADLLGRNFQDLGIKTFTQELRLTAHPLEKLTTLLGVYYFNEKIAQRNELFWGTQARPYADLMIRGATGGALNIASLEGLLSVPSGQFFAAGQGLTEAYRLKNDAWSIFAQADLEITDRLTATGGINYTHDRKRFSANVDSTDVFASIVLPGMFADLRQFQLLPPFLDVPNALEPGKVSDDDLSYTLRLSYDATDSVNLYLSYATGYKAASVNLSRDSRPNGADFNTVQTNPAYTALRLPNLVSGSRYAEPEDATVYEAGIKAQWGVATANFAVFRQVIKGFQSNIFTGSGFFLANAGKQSVTGFEVEGMVKPVEPLTLSLALTYLDGKYNSFVSSGVGDISGSTPPGFSPLSVTFGGQYDHAFGNGDRLILRGDYHYEAPFQLVEGLPGLVVRDPATGAIIDASAAIAAASSRKQDINDVNASITYAMDNGLEFSLWGRNLLDDRTILQIFDSPAQPDSISGYPNQPRTYGVSARYRW